MLTSGVLLLKPWMTFTGYQRKSKPCRRLPTVCSWVQPILRISLTTSLVFIGKSASFSQAALSAMNIDVDASRLLDIVSPFTTRTLKERKSNNKENLTKSPPSIPIKKSDAKSDFVIVESTDMLKKVRANTPDQSSSSSSAAPSSKNKHARSQSQPKAAVKSGLSFHFKIQYIS